MPLPTPKKLIHRPKLIVIDIDKTLTSYSSWFQLTSFLGADPDVHARLFTGFFKNYLTMDELKSGLFSLWNHQGPVTRQRVEQFCQMLPLRPEAVYAVHHLQQQGYFLAIISSSFKLLAQHTAQRLGIADWYGNTDLIFDEHGKWMDFTYDPAESALKLRQLQTLISRENLRPDQILLVGDGENDVALFQYAPGVAVESESYHLKLWAVETLASISELLPYLASLKELR